MKDVAIAVPRMMCMWMICIFPSDASTHSMRIPHSVHAKIVQTLETEIDAKRYALNKAARIIGKLQNAINETMETHKDIIGTLNQKLERAEQENQSLRQRVLELEDTMKISSTE